MHRIAWVVMCGLTACGPVPPPAAHQPLGGGALTVTAAFDATVKRTANQLRIEIADEAGDPVAGATVTVWATMTSHGHDAAAPEVRALRDGRYEAGPLSFPMAGRWDVKVHAVREATEGDAVLKATVP